MTNTIPDALSIGVVGVGAMGLPMAHNLHKAGYEVTAIDPYEPQRIKAESYGIPTAASVDALEHAAVILIMVANGDQLLSLLDSVAFAGATATRRTAVVTSTVGPAAVKEFASRAGEAGIDVIDLAVTGGVSGATDGTLTLLAGAPAPVIDRIRPVLDVIGNVVVCGGRPGDGQAVKLVNNLMSSVNLATVAEAMRLSNAMGLDPNKVLEISMRGAAASWMLADRGPRMAQAREDRHLDTYTSIFAKDTALISATAESVGVDVPLLDITAHQFQVAVEFGWAKEDDSSLVDLPSEALVPHATVSPEG
ncbi:NAD(P)-dependent oxidoreductase [Microbacterium sp.]|uniref:NAD(P)-dependent oxidoreductase n=1 Tax=Microbacterium sp. TaxID=51671 RepID=UPI003A91C1F5